MSGAALRHNPHVPFKFARLHSPSSRLPFRSLILQPPFLSLLPLPGVIYSAVHYIYHSSSFASSIQSLTVDLVISSSLSTHSSAPASIGSGTLREGLLTIPSPDPFIGSPRFARWLEFLLFPFGLVRHSASILCLFFSRQYSTLPPDTWFLRNAALQTPPYISSPVLKKKKAPHKFVFVIATKISAVTLDEFGS